MPEETYISDISAAGGRAGSASGQCVSVALDSGCVAPDTFSNGPGSEPLLVAKVVSTGVGPGVGPGVGSPTALWRMPRTSRRGCHSFDLGSAPTGSGIKLIFSLGRLPDCGDDEDDLFEEE